MVMLPLFVRIYSYVSFVLQKNDWVIDLAPSFHVIPHGVFFTSYSINGFGYVKIKIVVPLRLYVLKIFSWKLILEVSYFSKMLGML